MGLVTSLKKLALHYEITRSAKRDDAACIVAGMATMPSRIKSFNRAFKSLIRQVDRLYLYLDGHETLPEIVRGESKVVPIFAHEFPGLHANGKLLGLVLEPQPCLYFCADDDLYFPRRVIGDLRLALARYEDKAIVGFHGNLLARPLLRYYQGGRLSGSYQSALGADEQVDTLGTGAVLFSPQQLHFDVRDWPRVSMADLGLALEAARVGLPLISIARRRHSLISLGSRQADSLYVARQRDDTLQTRLGQILLELREPQELVRSEIAPVKYPSLKALIEAYGLASPDIA